MVVLGVKNEADLRDWEIRLANREVPFQTFVEPDMNEEKTALAVQPTEDERIFKKFRLLGA